jgi:hypothetical protein
MSHRAVLTLTVFFSAIAIGAAAGCGGSSDDHDKSVASQAAAQALTQERQRQQDAAEQQNIRKLKRKLRRERRKASNDGGSSPGSSGGGSQDCGSGITADSVTTCPFARNVVKAYRSSGGAAEVDAYSPATNKTYHMTCSGTSTTTCTGGHDASVTFKPSSHSSPGGDFCSTHDCIPSFDEGHGYIVQCADGEWSHSGGRPGACSQHGGETGNTHP